MGQTDRTRPQQILLGGFSGPSPEVRTPEPPLLLLPTEPKGSGPMQEWLQWPASELRFTQLLQFLGLVLTLSCYGLSP